MRPPEAVRVFVVDDEPIIAATLALILRNSGFSAVSFSDPVEALKQAASDRPDVLLSDVMMPKLSGVELAVQIRTLCPECVVVLISALASIDDSLEKAQAIYHGFSIHPKPIDPGALIREITEFASQKKPGATDRTALSKPA
jgi:CheY-like chemotaxis protein